MSVFKKIIVETIQNGLRDSWIERKQMGLFYDNHPWVMNYNYVFSRLQKLNNSNGLHIEKIRRHSYEMAVIYYEDEKTLYTICSDSKFESLLKRKSIDKYHFTDAFCLMSSHNGSGVQTNLFGEEVEVNTYEDLNDLLKSLMDQFSGTYDIQEYCILVCSFNHRLGIINQITGKYMCKNHDILKSDDTWNDYIQPDIESIEENENDDYSAGTSSYEIRIKDDVKVRLNKEKAKDESYYS